MTDKNTELLETIALLSVPLERAFHLALELVKEDTEMRQRQRDELKTAIKALLSNSLEVHEYLRIKSTELDFRMGGKDKYSELREKFQSHFPSEYDKDFNLHEMIDKEADRRFEESQKKKNT